MKIAVISDTHLGTPPSWLDAVYAKWLGPADVLIHCGDITSVAAWSYFMQHDRFLCVRGNCDWDPQLVHELEPLLTVAIGPLTVGITHGWGSRSRVPVTVAQALGPDCDLVCYGHTHQRDWSVVEGVQLVNPGSLGESGSLAEITISDEGLMDCRFIDAF
jgi:putative phosphoesterase